MVEESASKAKDFETYLISALNDSLLKKSKQERTSPLLKGWFLDSKLSIFLTIRFV